VLKFLLWASAPPLALAAGLAWLILWRGSAIVKGPEGLPPGDLRLPLLLALALPLLMALLAWATASRLGVALLAGFGCALVIVVSLQALSGKPLFG